MDNEDRARLSIEVKRKSYPYQSPLYLLAQMAAAVLTLNVILPVVLHVNFTGSLLDQGVFMMLFGAAYVAVSFLFLAIAGYLAIVTVVAANLKKLKLADINNQDVARALALRVLMGNQPRWLISLTPCVVPATSFAVAAALFGEKLHFDNNLLLLESCLLTGMTAFTLCLPFVISTQRSFCAVIATNTSDQDQPESQEADEKQNGTGAP